MGGREKDYHDWQQPLSEAEYYIQKLSAPGDLVCDPFGGSFTAAIACYRLDRRFVGCDLDEGNVKIGYHRLAEEEEKRREAEETASQTAEEAPSVDDLAAEPVTHSEVEKLFYIEYPTIETVNVIGETERTYVIVYLDSGDEQRVSKSEVGTDWFVDEQSAQQELRKMLADEITEHQEEKDKLQEQLVAVGGVNPSSDVGAEGDMALLDNVVIAQNFARMLGGFDAFRLACECAEELTAAELADSEWIDSQSV